MSDSANPFAPPVAEVRDVAVAGEPALAGRGQRLLAVLLDTAIYFVILWVASYALPLNFFNPDPSMAELVVNTLAGVALFLAVQGYTLVTRGQSLGKIALGLRIVRADGSKVGAARMLGLRYGVGLVIGVIPFLGPLYSLLDALLIFRASRRCLHDNIADTIVVKA